jgi:O-antigen ligase
VKEHAAAVKDTVGVQIALLVSTSIFLGVYLQIGDNRYAPNISLKIVGVVIPMITASLILLFREKSVDFFRLSRYQLIWIFSFIGLIIAQFTNTSNRVNYVLGAPDRNLGLITFGLMFLGYFVGKYLSRFNLQVLIFSIVVFSLIQSLIVLYQRFLKSDVIGLTGSTETPAIFGTFYNSNSLSFFLGISCSALFALVLNSKGTKMNLIALSIAALILIYGLAVSGSSQGLIGFIGIFVVYSLKKYMGYVKENFSTILVVVYGVSLCTFLGAVSLIQLTSDSDIATNPYLERLEIYKSAISMSLHNPFLGVGIDSFASSYGAFTTSSDLKLVDNAHSIFLHVLSTQGLLGGLLFLSFIISVLRLKHKEVNSSVAQWNFFQSAFFAFALIGIIGIEHPTISFFAFVSAGVLNGMSEDRKDFKQIIINNKVMAITTLAIGILVAVATVPNTVRDFRVAGAITNLSDMRISAQEFKAALPKEYGEISNSRLLLNLGQAFVALDNRQEVVRVAEVMLRNFPEDQRTSVLFFLIAEKWSDREANRIAVDLRDQLFPRASNL